VTRKSEPEDENELLFPPPEPPPGSRQRRLGARARARLSRGLFILPTLFTVGTLFCG
jgi:hypothetical protein